MDQYRLEHAEHLPGLSTIVDEFTERSILATLNNTPVFAEKAIADRVLDLLNGGLSTGFWCRNCEYLESPNDVVGRGDEGCAGCGCEESAHVTATVVEGR